MAPRLAPRAILWTGAGCIVAALLLDGDVLRSWLGPMGAAHPAVAVAAALFLRLPLFAGGIAALQRGRVPAGASAPSFPLPVFAAGAGALLGAHAAAAAFSRSTGVAELLFAGAALLLLLLALRQAAALLAGALDTTFRVPLLRRPLLAILALTILAALLELALGALAHRASPPAPGAVASRLVMPDALARREAVVPGAQAAWWWQGKLHVFDADGFRRTAPFPPKRPGVLRVLAVGDSLTYGYGVAAEEAWPAVLERELQRTAPAEVLNLGVCGLQSEGILEILTRWLPRLEPDLVLYGVCLNDFLPGQRPEYENNRAWQLPVPGKFHLVQGTRVGALAAERYDRLLMGLGVRSDFLTDILRGSGGYRERFARDTAAMNRLVTARGLPPVVALVLYQVPDARGKAARLVRVAEEDLRAAGMTVVPADYLLANDGRRDLVVGPWEGHPSAEAHRIFAGEFLKALPRR